MSKGKILPTRECNILMIDVPSVHEVMSVMTSELLNASQLLSKIFDASVILEQTIHNSRFVDESAHWKVHAVRQSACKLENNLEIAIFDIQERMKSLETVLNRKAVIPAILSRPDDISVAFHIAVNNGPAIDWPFAEAVLERFLFLWTEEKMEIMIDYNDDDNFRECVWYNSNFDRNMIKLLQEGRLLGRVSKSVELIQKIVDDVHYLDVSASFFNSLASILLKPVLSAQEDEERILAYLIVKNQDKSIDCSISRLIDSYIYSRKGKTRIACNVLKIISRFIVHENSDRDNKDNFENALKISKALVKVLIEEKDENIIDMCLNLLIRLDSRDDYLSMIEIDYLSMIGIGICEALMNIIKTFPLDRKKMENVQSIIYDITYNGQLIEIFVSLGLLHSLVEAFNSPYQELIPDLVGNLCKCDKRIIDQFIALGVPKGSDFFPEE
jgi:hypothetical protein